MEKQQATPGAALASMRLRAERQCVQCGKSFTSIGLGRYCSGACRKKAYYYRNKSKRQTAAGGQGDGQ